MYQSRNPYTGVVASTYPDATANEIEAVLTAGDAYYHRHYNEPVANRAAQLAQIAQTFDDRAEQLAALATADMGKRHQEALAEAHAAANIARFYAANGPQALAPRPYPFAGGSAELLTQATGIVLAIEPWNFPYTQVMRVFAPNFLLGNAVVLKHASNVPSCALAFAACVAVAVEAGAFANLFATREQINTMIADDRVQGVALTGSPQAGRQIAQEAGAALTKTTMELGGNDALVVLADADLGQAAQAAADSRLRNAGQVCTSAKRFIVNAAVANDFLAALKPLWAQYHPGDPADFATTLAPLASAQAAASLQAQVESAVHHGAPVLIAGGRVADSEALFEPILLGQMAPDNPQFDAEFFGPVGQLLIAANDNEAIKLANQSQYGLAGAVFGTPAHARKVASRMETGQVFINQAANGYPQLPFGGVKHSGYGREMSELALTEFANQKIMAESK
ncbi:aldehyde dehydrogenase family protein [Lacticaseibacillus jixiensis]|uniref:aldehyde dehydrogenase family protein n=1 Tax=Lacticaseibacillus jixiensis TaxID=3231926 RepID=UPI0036F33CB1